MPKIIGKSVRVVEEGGFAIDECAGNVATKDDTISIAHVHVKSPTSEPWLTLHYDEWLCVRKGQIDLHYFDEEGGNDDNEKILTVREGETAFVGKGERFRPYFPVGDTEYIPICCPAFRPDRCIREEDEVTSGVSKKLKELHSGNDKDASSITTSSIATTSRHNEGTDILYHMCQKALWEKCVATGEAYFPPTFEKDGMFTHATAVPERLVETGNHFYTLVPGEWICLQLSRAALAKLGILTKFEEAKPVGDTKDSKNWDWVCPHIYGGLPTCVNNVVTKIYDIQRDEKGMFLSIVGLKTN